MLGDKYSSLSEAAYLHVGYANFFVREFLFLAKWESLQVNPANTSSQLASDAIDAPLFYSISVTERENPKRIKTRIFFVLYAERGFVSQGNLHVEIFYSAGPRVGVSRVPGTQRWGCTGGICPQGALEGINSAPGAYIYYINIYYI